MTLALRLAAVYNVAWGGLTLAYPNWLFDLTGLEPPRYPFIWQCVGMIVGVYGLGYWWASRDPARHWPIVAVGLLGKLFGPMGYVTGLVAGGLGLSFVPPVPAEFGVTLVTNDLIWWVPFTLILLHALRVNSLGVLGPVTDPETAITEATTSDGRTIAELSVERPVLLVFLRHTGCTFCKEAMADLRAERDRVERAGATPVFVHMSPPADFERFLERYGFGGSPHVSDPGRGLYRSFGLERGSLKQLFGPVVWLRGAVATLRGHTVGRLVGDGFQMPGVFLIRRGRVSAAHRHRSAADRPDYAQLACAAG